MMHARVKALIVLLVWSALIGAGTARAAFPGSNGTIAYVIRAPNGARMIETAFMNPGGVLAPATPSLRETPVDRAGESFDPAWSANGRHLAFVSTLSGHRQIYTIALALSGGLTQACGVEVCPLTEGKSESYEPAWSYNGSSIVFTSTASGSPQIYEMTAAGEDMTRLTFDKGSDSQPAWSRSGEIAFVDNASGSPQIYLMNSAGGELRALTHSGVHSTPTWAPNGTELAYQSQTSTGFQLTTFETNRNEVFPEALSYMTPEADRLAFSPDGTQLLVSGGSGVTGHDELELLSLSFGDTLPPRRVLSEGEQADWAPLPVAPVSSPQPTSAGVSAIARPLSGSVLFSAGHSTATLEPAEPTGFTEATSPPSATSLTKSVEVPVFGTYDTTHGVVEVTVASSTNAAPATAVLTGGQFLFSQSRATAVPTIRLLGRPHHCAHRTRRATIARSHGRGPHIHGHTHGHFHEGGDDGGASSESTRWEITNTCQGTIYRALEDSLLVSDPHRRRPVRVAAGHEYLVRPGR